MHKVVSKAPHSRNDTRKCQTRARKLGADPFWGFCADVLAAPASPWRPTISVDTKLRTCEAGADPLEDQGRLAGAQQALGARQSAWTPN